MILNSKVPYSSNVPFLSSDRKGMEIVNMKDLFFIDFWFSVNRINLVLIGNEVLGDDEETGF